MRNISLSCFRDFSCLAGACPDTCCSGWQVDLDDETAEKYKAFPGVLGDEIRDRLVSTEDGCSFRMDGKRCPFLNDDNLCRLILAHGDSILSTTCREHPRFWEEYKDIRETALSVSCPEAARLLFTGDLALTEEDSSEVLPDCDYDEELFALLWEVRNDYMTLLQGDTSFSTVCEELLAEGKAIQQQCDLWFSLEPGREYTGSIQGFLRQLETIHFTDGRLPEKLKKAKWDDTLLHRCPAPAKRLLYYFLYRYLLTAVWDGMVLEKVLFCLYSVYAIYALAEDEADLLPAAILYSREVEHSPENLAGIFAFLYVKAL